jgi:hypothetical protein
MSSECDISKFNMRMLCRFVLKYIYMMHHAINPSRKVNEENEVTVVFDSRKELPLNSSLVYIKDDFCQILFVSLAP